MVKFILQPNADLFQGRHEKLFAIKIYQLTVCNDQNIN